MIDLESYVAVSKLVILLSGGFVTVLAARAYRRTGSPRLRALAAGLGLVTLGALLGGAIHLSTPLGFEVGVAVQTTFTALGFVILAYSLYAGSTPSDGPGGDDTGGVSGSGRFL
jgi:hypothetical protein